MIKKSLLHLMKWTGVTGITAITVLSGGLCLTAGSLNAQQRSTPTAPLSIYALQCDHLSVPLGIDDPQPLLSWKWQQPSNGSFTAAAAAASADSYYCRISVDTDSLALTKGPGRYWNSGFQHLQAPFKAYAGAALQPFTRYYWKIEWTKDTTAPGSGSGADQKISWFETGLQKMSNWTGAWISDDHPIGFKPAGYFRKAFLLKKPIKTARIYIAAAGLYRLLLNGRKVGNRELDPIYTRFDRRILYTAYDATALLQSGDNAIGVVMGNGWYNLQSTAVWDFDKAPWRGRPAFCLDLRITYTDGSVQTIATGKDWKTKTGSVVFNSIYTAEHQDDRLSMPGWSKPHPQDPGWADSLWQPVIFRSAPARKITAASFVPIRKYAPIKPVSVQKFNDTDYVFNLGENFAGISEIRVQGAAGTVLRLKHGERLYKNGHVDISNIDVHYRPTDNSDPFQTDIYTLSGKGTEVFRPWFNYKGFQYVEVTSSRPVDLSKDALTGYFMHSDVAPVGYIHSSDSIINKIWAATNQSYLSNLFGYPTDCPQREKNGWTGDAQINIQTGLYNFDGITVYQKWLQDHLDEQQPNGVLPSIIPSNGWGYEWGNGPDWTSTIAIIPWNLYLFYGDSRPLKMCYQALKAYVNHITSISPSGLCSWGLGDWVPVKSKTPVTFTSTIYYYTDVQILAKAARLFGKDADAGFYESLAVKIKDAFNQKYLDKATGMYGEGFQTELSAPLYWGVVPEEQKAMVAANLNQRVIKDGYHLDVGLLGSKTILGALSRNGYANTAYRLAARRTYPSWGWWMVNGATTLYENWDIASAHDISLNHIMFGEIGAWLYKGLGGIFPDPEAPGFRHIQLRPNIPVDLDHFEARHTGPYGEIRVSWKKEGERRRTGRSEKSGKEPEDQRTVMMDIVIPPFSTATLHLSKAFRHINIEENGSAIAPAKAGEIRQKGDNGTQQVELNAGRYHLTLKVQ